MQMVYMQYGRTALHYAKSAEIAKVLIDNDADIHKMDRVCVCGWIEFLCMSLFGEGVFEAELQSFNTYSLLV